MVKIYKLTADDEQIGDICYNKRHVINKATHLAMYIDETIAIWEAEEVEGLDVDLLEWNIIRAV